MLVLTAVVGVARWFTTSYRIDADPESGQVQLRAGLLHRKVLSVPRNRIRSVQTDARLLHRLLGLAVLRVSTGQEARAEHGFELNAVRVDEVPRLRAILLAAIAAAGRSGDRGARAVEHGAGALAAFVVAIRPVEPLRAIDHGRCRGLLYQTGAVGPLQHSRLAQSGLKPLNGWVCRPPSR